MILSCTGCGKSLKVADEHAGRRARCPSCSTLVVVPHSHAKVAEPAMATAASPAAAAKPSATPHQPLPMVAPQGHAYQQPQTSMIPAPPTYTPQQSHYSPQPVVHQHYGQPATKDPAIAALLEVLGGLFAQTFGIGHIYAGNVGLGLAFMFGYWFLCFFNFILMMFLIGFLTFPLCWIGAMILSPILAANSVKRY